MASFIKSQLKGFNAKLYWRVCILVVIVPLGEFLYAQSVDKLNIENKKTYGDNIYFDLEKEFKPFVDIFNRVDKRTINKKSLIHALLIIIQNLY